jgi:hypothetical protein
MYFFFKSNKNNNNNNKYRTIQEGNEVYKVSNRKFKQNKHYMVDKYQNIKL